MELIMFSEYIGAALRRAKYESLENGSYVATTQWSLREKGHKMVRNIARISADESIYTKAPCCQP